MAIDRPRPARRHLRSGLVLLLVLGSTALIGWGGLAAWQAVTGNNGSSFGTGGVHMQNVATITYPSSAAPVSCTDLTSPGGCGAIFSVAGAAPGFAAPVGTVEITNTGTLPTTFTLGLGSAVTTGQGTTLCGDLNLSIVDANGVTVYDGALTGLAATPNLDSSLSSATWNQSDSNTFTFSLALPGSLSSDQNSTCTADFTWTQTQV